MNKNFTKSHKNQKPNFKKSKEKIITPSKKTLEFILSYAKNTNKDVGLLQNYVDATGQYARITTFIKNTGVDEMERVEESLNKEIEKIFKTDRYDVSITCKSYLFQN